MTVEELINAIQDVQTNIISLSADDAGDKLASVYLEELRQLLEKVSRLDDETKKQIRPIIEQFSAQLSNRVTELETQMDALKSEAEQEQIRQRTARAYSGARKLF